VVLAVIGAKPQSISMSLPSLRRWEEPHLERSDDCPRRIDHLLQRIRDHVGLGSLQVPENYVQLQVHLAMEFRSDRMEKQGRIFIQALPSPRNPNWCSMVVSKSDDVTLSSPFIE
jgi:hypothetical protein